MTILFFAFIHACAACLFCAMTPYRCCCRRKEFSTLNHSSTESERIAIYLIDIKSRARCSLLLSCVFMHEAVARQGFQ